MTTSLPTPKKAVALIEAAFKDRNSDIVTKEAYHLLAQLWGYKDWATASAALKANAPAKVEKPQGPTCLSSTAVADWPAWVFCNRGGNEDEPLYVYPFGTRLDDLYAGRRHWHLINDSKTYCMEMPSELLSPADSQLVVGEEVACAYPDSEEYGVPACATDHGVADFLKEELGFSYVGSPEGRSYVEVTGRCRGDDGATEWWVQVRVHPSVHARLLNTFTKDRCEFERDYLAADIPSLIAPGMSGDAVRKGLADVCNQWFSAYGERTLAELCESLYGYHPRGNAHEALPGGFVLKAGLEQATTHELLAALTNAVSEARQALSPA